MEKKGGSVDRRDFLRIGTFGTAAAALGTTLAAGTILRDDGSFRFADRTPGEPAEATLLLEPGIMTLSAPSGAVLRRTPWALPVDAEPYFDIFTTATVPNADSIERWSTRSGNDDPASAADPLSIITRFPLLGGEPCTEIAAQMIDAMRTGSDASLTFFAFDNDTAPRTIINRGPLPVIDDRPLTSPSRIRPDAAPGFTSPAIAGWRIQYRGVETHPLPSCVGAGIPVTHVHLEIAHNEPAGSKYWPIKLTAHLGTYRSSGKRCFVLYIDTPRKICIKVCSPTWNDLYGMLSTAIYAAAAAAGVAIAGWVVASIAAAGASAMYVPLLLLV
jgi:hypothetical protein